MKRYSRWFLSDYIRSRYNLSFTLYRGWRTCIETNFNFLLIYFAIINILGFHLKHFRKINNTSRECTTRTHLLEPVIVKSHYDSHNYWILLLIPISQTTEDTTWLTAAHTYLELWILTYCTDQSVCFARTPISVKRNVRIYCFSSHSEHSTNIKIF